MGINYVIGVFLIPQTWIESWQDLFPLKRGMRAWVVNEMIGAVVSYTPLISSAILWGISGQQLRKYLCGNAIFKV